MKSIDFNATDEIVLFTSIIVKDIRWSVSDFIPMKYNVQKILKINRMSISYNHLRTRVFQLWDISGNTDEYDIVFNIDGERDDITVLSQDALTGSIWKDMVSVYIGICPKITVDTLAPLRERGCFCIVWKYLFGLKK